jgi:hypothetical protein
VSLVALRSSRAIMRDATSPDRLLRPHPDGTADRLPGARRPAGGRHDSVIPQTLADTAARRTSPPTRRTGAQAVRAVRPAATADVTRVAARNADTREVA